MNNEAARVFPESGPAGDSPHCEEGLRSAMGSGCSCAKPFSSESRRPSAEAAGGPGPAGGGEELLTGLARTTPQGNADAETFLTYYKVVHAMPGRVRIRPMPGFTGQARAVRGQVVSFFAEKYSDADIRLSEKTGSILILSPGLFGPQADMRKLLNAKPAVPGHERFGPDVRDERSGKGNAVPAIDSEVHNPIPGKVRSFFYPRIFNFAYSVLRSVPYIFKGIRQLLKARLNLDVLDGAALVVCLLRRDFKTLSSITFFFALGDYLADWTKKKSRASLEESLALNIDQIWIRADGVECLIPYADLKVGGHVVVRAGSAMPVDGCVIDGEGMVNQASMTGEPLAVPRSQGSSVYAGTILEEGELVVEALKVGGETRINAILKTIEESESAKASVQGRYERIADAIVPYNFLLSGAVYAASRSPMRAGSVLLVDYSCAIRLAAPLCVFTAMQEAASHGVLIKGGKFMEAIAEADVVVLDKTGTLTNARPELVEVVPFGGRKRSTVLRLAACLEEHFTHPVGQAVVRASEEEGLRHREEHTKVEFIVAHGIASSWRGQRVLIGSDHFVLEDEGVPITEKQQQIALDESRKGRSVLFLSIGGELAGLLLIEDQVRADASAVVEGLRKDGVKRIVMLTGDNEESAAAIAASAGIYEFQARMLPEDKAAYVRALKAAGHTVAMVGDGINDSPALSEAHVGIAMAEGADMAREVADIVMNRGLDGLLLTRRISRLALNRIHSNFRRSLFWNSAFLMGGLMGVLMPGLSAFLHNATTAAIAVSSVRPLLPAPETEAYAPKQRESQNKINYNILEASE